MQNEEALRFRKIVPLWKHATLNAAKNRVYRFEWWWSLPVFAFKCWTSPYEHLTHILLWTESHQTSSSEAWRGCLFHFKTCKSWLIRWLKNWEFDRRVNFFMSQCSISLAWIIYLVCKDYKLTIFGIDPIKTWKSSLKDLQKVHSWSSTIEKHRSFNWRHQEQENRSEACKSYTPFGFSAKESFNRYQIELQQPIAGLKEISAQHQKLAGNDKRKETVFKNTSWLSHRSKRPPSPKFSIR